MSKYDELSGNIVLTTTPYGLLMDILVETNLPIYLYVLDKNCIQYSLDKTFWSTLNVGLGKRLLEMSEYCDNIKIIYKFGDDEDA